MNKCSLYSKPQLLALNAIGCVTNVFVLLYKLERGPLCCPDRRNQLPSRQADFRPRCFFFFSKELILIDTVLHLIVSGSRRVFMTGIKCENFTILSDIYVLYGT